MSNINKNINNVVPKHLKSNNRDKHSSLSSEELDKSKHTTNTNDILDNQSNISNGKLDKKVNFSNEDNLNNIINKSTIIEEKQKKRKLNKEKKQQRKKQKKYILIEIGIIVLIYLLGVLFFTFFTYPKTAVADTDISLKTSGVLKSELNQNSDTYILNIEGLDFNYNIKGKDIDYVFDSNQVVDKINDLKNPFIWPYEIFMSHEFISEELVSYNKEKINMLIIPEIENHNLKSIRPVNAALLWDSSLKTLSIQPEIVGNTLNLDKTLTTIYSYVGNAKKNLEISENEQLLPDYFSNNEKINSTLEEAKIISKTIINLQLLGTNVSVLDASIFGPWIKIVGDYKAGIDETPLNEWVFSLCNSCNTVGKARTYTTPYGKTCTVNGGNKGWSLNEEALLEQINANILSGNSVVIDIPTNSSMDAFTGPGGRDWGSRYIDVDLSQQHAWMYDESGNLIWQSAIVSGKPDGEHNTPTGVWTILDKKSPEILKGNIDPATGQREYETKVQYWMAVTYSGVGFHDATWQSGFGGSRYANGAGSHGCMNLPLYAAGSLYSLCKSGDIVVIHN